MRFRPLLCLAVLLPLFLASCGDLPEPFLGNPGATARRLAVPETPLLVVPPPIHALLSGGAGTDYAALLALTLQKEEVPSLVRPAHKGDWLLDVTAERRGDQIIPHYAIGDPNGRQLGTIEGAALPAAAWTAGAPWTLGQAAQDAVPKVLALMMSLRATRDRANPNSLLNRPARLYVPDVVGAPGDGNLALGRLIRARLAEFGPLVQVTPDGADFIVRGQVILTNQLNNQQRVEIVWTVTRPSGVVNGKVSQLNMIPAGALDHYWGDVAGAVTQEASGGINEVVRRFIRGEATPAEAPGGGTPAAPAGGGPLARPPLGVPPSAAAPLGATPSAAAPALGAPVPGVPVRGVPVRGVPVRGAPVPGVPVSGVPVSGTPALGAPVRGAPVPGTPAATVPGAPAAVPRASVRGAPLPAAPVSGALVPGSPAAAHPGASVGGATSGKPPAAARKPTRLKPVVAAQPAPATPAGQ
jgi:hypothetical protein